MMAGDIVAGVDWILEAIDDYVEGRAGWGQCLWSTVGWVRAGATS